MYQSGIFYANDTLLYLSITPMNSSNLVSLFIYSMRLSAGFITSNNNESENNSLGSLSINVKLETRNLSSVLILKLRKLFIPAYF